jgi:hypothetical protein
MAQQTGFKRAIKVAERARNKKIKEKAAGFRRAERADEIAAAPAPVPAKK